MGRTPRIRAVLSTVALLLLPAAATAQVQPVRSVLTPATSNAAAAEAFHQALDAGFMWSWTSAAEHAARALQLDPKLAAARVLALNLARDGSPAGLAALDAAVAEAARSSAAEASWALGIREVVAGRLAMARPLLDAAVTLSPGDTRVALERALALAPAERIAALRELVSANPQRPEMRMWLAYYLTLVPFGVDPVAAEEALGHAREAVRLAPDQTGPHTALAHALERMTRHAEALEALGTATRLRPTNQYAYQLLAEIAIRDGDPVKARDALEEAERLAPGPNYKSAYRRYRAMSYAYGGDLKRAVAQLRDEANAAEEAGLRGQAATAHALIVPLLAAQADVDGVRQHLAEGRRLGAVGPGVTTATLAFGLAGNAAEARAALDAYTAATAAAPIPESLHLVTGYTLLAENRAADAIPEFRRAGANPYAGLGLVMAYEQLGDRANMEAERQKLLARKDFAIESTGMAIARHRYGGKRR